MVTTVHVCIRLSKAGILSKRLNRLNWFSAQTSRSDIFTNRPKDTTCLQKLVPPNLARLFCVFSRQNSSTVTNSRHLPYFLQERCPTRSDFLGDRCK